MRPIACSRLLAALLIGVAASSFPGASGTGTPGQTLDQIASAARAVTPSMMLGHVKALAADDKEGRAPGTAGEERTVGYLVGQYKRLGLAPGNPDGTYVQDVPLIGFKGEASAAFDVNGTPVPLAVPDEAVVVSRQGLPEVSVAKSATVFVGYGAVAPEFAWDDFKGVDVRGKAIVMLAGDPAVADPANPAALDPAVFNGALDNGSGMATMLALAEAFTRLEGGTKRSVLVFSPTAEESAMLGAKDYAEHPLWPLEKTLADINMDIMNVWGRAKAIVSIGYGKTTLDDLLVAEAAKQGRIVLPDPEAEKGYFYRSDHFELAKQGVPALHFLHPGANYRDRPPDYGQRMRDRYTSEDDHKVTDEVKADWDLSGAVEDAQLLFGAGLAVAQGQAYPEWKPGTEFRAVRAARLKAK